MILFHNNNHILLLLQADTRYLLSPPPIARQPPIALQRPLLPPSNASLTPGPFSPSSLFLSLSEQALAEGARRLALEKLQLLQEGSLRVVGAPLFELLTAIRYQS